jgi:hypothetical protein
MLLYFTELGTKNSLAINPEYVVLVFQKIEDDNKTTLINMINGNVAVEEDYLETVGRINAVK